MAPGAGVRIGPYEIVSAIGAGGMARSIARVIRGFSVMSRGCRLAFLPIRIVWRVSNRRTRTVLYRSRRTSHVRADSIAAAGAHSAGRHAVPLFSTQIATGAAIGSVANTVTPQYDVAADGRFLMNVALEAPVTSPIEIVLNWASGLTK